MNTDKLYPIDVKGKVIAKRANIGRGVVIEAGAVIEADDVVIGDYAFIGKNVTVKVPSFKLGSYSKLNADSFAYGFKPMQIGRNCWIGGKVRLDSIGGLDIADNVGIGCGSQVWTHIRFGDVVQGNRFYGEKHMLIRSDAWFVGECLVSPVRVGARSMAMLGSVITKDMEPDHTYAGAPAIDVTGKLGRQFEQITEQQKAEIMQGFIDRWVINNPDAVGRLVVKRPDLGFMQWRDGVTVFDVTRRLYRRTNSVQEVKFLKAHMPALFKFTPYDEPEFIEPQQPVESFITLGG